MSETSGTVAGWVWPANVELLMEYLAGWAGYAWSPLDDEALDSGLARSDADRDVWAEHRLAGETASLMVRLAREVEAVPVLVRVEGITEPYLLAQVETLLTLLSDSRISLAER